MGRNITNKLKMAELKGRKQQRLDDFTEDLCLHFLLCKIRSSLLFKLLFAAKSVLQVPHEASLLPAECHFMAESFSVILQCDLCMLAMDQATGQDTHVLLQHSFCHPGKSTSFHIFPLFLGTQEKFPFVNSY